MSDDELRRLLVPGVADDYSAGNFAAEIGYHVGVLFMERDDLRSQLAAAQAERDALKAGKWAGRWTNNDPEAPCWNRETTRGGLLMQVYMLSSGKWRCCDNVKHGEPTEHPTADEAKAAADAALKAAGWWLEGSEG